MSASMSPIVVLILFIAGGPLQSFQQGCSYTSPFFLGAPRVALSPPEQVIQRCCPEFQSCTDLYLGSSPGDSNHVKYDPLYGMVYWTNTDQTTVHRGIHDERYTNEVPCFTETILDGADVIDIDLQHRKLYWSCTSCDGVGVANLDGSDKVEIYGGSSGTMCGDAGVGGFGTRDIKIDSTNEILYWGSGGTSDRLSKGSVSLGSVCQDLRTGVDVECIELNADGTKIYWITRAGFFDPNLLLQCGDTSAPNLDCGSGDDNFITVSGFPLSFDMVLYDSYFYITAIDAGTETLKVFRVMAVLGATVDSTFSVIQQIGSLFAQPLITAAEFMSTAIDLNGDGYEGTEDDSVLVVISRSGNLYRCSTITLTTVQSGTANPVDNYVETTQELTFTPGSSTVSMHIDLPDNNLLEGDRTFMVSLSNPIEGVLGSITSATVTVKDNESGFWIGTQDMSVFDESGTVSINVIRDTYINAEANAILTIQSATLDGTLPSDFSGSNSRDVSFAAGATSVNIQFTLVDDNIWESRETFGVTLTFPSGCCVIDPSSIDIIIEDNDDIVQISADNFEVVESSRKVTVTLSRQGNNADEITVLISTFDASANGNGDYVGLRDIPVTIPAGESLAEVDITITDDQTREAEEYFLVVLTSRFPEEIGNRYLARVYIQDDEVELRMTESSMEVLESVGLVRIPVTRLGYELTSVSIDIAIDVSSPSIAVLETPTVVFSSGMTDAFVVVRVLNDAQIEATMKVAVTIVRADGGAVRSPDTTIISIQDDDILFEFLQEVTLVLESAGVVLVTIVKRGCLQCASSLDYQTEAFTASSGVDYVSAFGTITFDSGETQRSITIHIIDDFDAEGDEEIRLTLIGPSGTSETRVIIMDDDMKETTRGITDECASVRCFNGETCFRGTCVCPNDLNGGSCGEQPAINTMSTSLTIAEILGLSIGIVVGTLVSVITISMCLMSVQRASVVAKTPPPQTPANQLPSLQLDSFGSLDMSNMVTAYSSPTSNPLFQQYDFGIEDTYYGPNRRNLFF